MRTWAHGRWQFPLPDGHRYPVFKHRLLCELLLQTGVCQPVDLLDAEPLRLVDADAGARRGPARPHPPGTAERPCQRGLGLPWSPDVVERGRRASHGTVLAAHEALRTGVAIKHGGGSHQGGGTAELFAADPDAFTLSLHGARNYPFRRVPSDLDIDLPSGTTDTAYLTALDGAPHAVAYLVLKFCASRKKQTTLPSLLA